MIFTRLVIGAFALLLLLPVQKLSAEHIYVDPWLDGCNFIWDYGEVQVGDTESTTLLFYVDQAGSVTVYEIAVIGSDAFTIDYEVPLNDTLYPDDPDDPDDDGLDRMEVTVTFSPEVTGEQESVLYFYSNAINENNCSPEYTLSTIEYRFVGTGVEVTPTPAEMMDALLEFFDQAVADGDIVGSGKSSGASNAHVRVVGNMLNSAGAFIEAEEYTDACEALTDAALRSDGNHPPPDFVEGDAVPTLNAMILEVMDALGC